MSLPGWGDALHHAIPSILTSHIHLPVDPLCHGCLSAGTTQTAYPFYALGNGLDRHHVRHHTAIHTCHGRTMAIGLDIAHCRRIAERHHTPHTCSTPQDSISCRSLHLRRCHWCRFCIGRKHHLYNRLPHHVAHRSVDTWTGYRNAPHGMHRNSSIRITTPLLHAQRSLHLDTDTTIVRARLSAACGIQLHASRPDDTAGYRGSRVSAIFPYPDKHARKDDDKMVRHLNDRPCAAPRLDTRRFPCRQQDRAIPPEHQKPRRCPGILRHDSLYGTLSGTGSAG